MTKRTRYFMLGSGTLLVAGLCTGLLAYYGGFPTGASSQSANLAELRYVPQDATVVAYANVREVMNSQFRQRIREMAPGHEQGRDQFEQQTGIDIDNDIDYVLAYMLPDEQTKGGLVLARGRFDEARLQALALEKHGTTGQYKGKRLLHPAQVAAHAGGDKPAREHPVLAFMEPGLLAVGDETTIRRSIDTQQGGANVSANTEIMSLLTDAQGSGNAWAVGRFDALTSRAHLPENVSKQLPAISSFALTSRVNGGVSGTFRAETRDADAATNLRDVVRGFLALAKMQAGSKPEMQSLMQSLELGGTGTTVALSFSIPAEVIDLLAPKMKKPAEPIER